MSAGTSIEWTEATWNPVSGCTRASPGCDNCYAVPMTHRLEAIGQTEKYGGLTVLNNRGDRHFNGTVKCHDDDLEIPLHWKKPRRIFVNSMSDLFHREVPFEFIDKVFAVMALCPQHTFQVLTKRPERMAEYMIYDDRDVMIQDAMDQKLKLPIGRTFVRELSDWPIPNVWLGTSCENQKTFDERAHQLAKVPAAVRFLSLEPLLGPISWGSHTVSIPWAGGVSHGGREYSRLIDFIHWVIVGGESGKNARPCNIEWIRSIVQQCKVAGVPCFVKQLGKWIVGSHEFDGWKGLIDRWLLKHANGETATFHRPILRSQYLPQLYDDRPTNAVAWGLADPKGGEMNEWPHDLRVREWPNTGAAPCA